MKSRSIKFKNNLLPIQEEISSSSSSRVPQQQQQQDHNNNNNNSNNQIDTKNEQQYQEQSVLPHFDSPDALSKYVLGSTNIHDPVKFDLLQKSSNAHTTGTIYIDYFSDTLNPEHTVMYVANKMKASMVPYLHTISTPDKQNPGSNIVRDVTDYYYGLSMFVSGFDQLYEKDDDPDDYTKLIYAVKSVDIEIEDKEEEEKDGSEQPMIIRNVPVIIDPYTQEFLDGLHYKITGYTSILPIDMRNRFKHVGMEYDKSAICVAFIVVTETDSEVLSKKARYVHNTEQLIYRAYNEGKHQELIKLHEKAKEMVVSKENGNDDDGGNNNYNNDIRDKPDEMMFHQGNLSDTDYAKLVLKNMGSDTLSNLVCRLNGEYITDENDVVHLPIIQTAEEQIEALAENVDFSREYLDVLKSYKADQKSIISTTTDKE